uniref:Phosphoinositide phospholipase C n=1 Tax=Oryzias sinensis TaxID=183150 RepID=A0A8C7Y2G0_9TELE
KGGRTCPMKILIKRDLEMGVVMTVFRQKAERLTVQVIMETRQVAWTRTADKTDGVLDLLEIREIRPGRNSKDFERFKDGKDKHGENTCFTIFYGSQFVLSTLSLGADSVDEAQKWLTGLEMLRQETQALVFCPFKIKSDLVQSFPNPLTWPLSALHFDVSRFKRSIDLFSHLQAFSECFSSWLRKQMYSILDEFKREACSFILGNTDKPDASAVLLHDFQRFLIYDQKESWANNLNQVRELMTTFIDDTMRRTNDPEFTVSEFLGFLFSKENAVWDEKYSEINNLNMNNPLSHYWINSSHNTYLTGDQLRSESSTEAYVRCLRLGCRCVELDCWEGPGEPIIYHGWTRTTKIKFEDVVKAINEHAFVTSDFPLILSIEEHCPIEQQRQMARIFKEVFGDKLLTEPVEHMAEQLPSPTQLKGKIVLKVRTTESPGSWVGPVLDVRNDTCVCVRAAQEAQWFPFFFFQRWNKHYCVISDDKLYYAEEYEQEEEDPKKVKYQDMHCSEPWFHGQMKEGRQMAERRIHEYCTETGRRDGTFLVRQSDTYVTDYTLSFWRGGRVQHCRIRSGSEGGHTYFFLTPNLHFPTVYSLIQHYKDMPLRCQDFELRLTDAVPKPDSHLQEGWFYSNLSRGQAEDYLLRIPRDGAFLIRQREGEPDSFAITFRGDGKVKHCRIQKEGGMFLLGSTTEFESLVELVNYYKKKPLYRKIKLRYPVTPELVQRFITDDKCASLYEIKTYVDPNEIEPAVPQNTVKAIYSYTAKRQDELSFSKGALIHNVFKESEGWYVHKHTAYTTVSACINVCFWKKKKEMHLIGHVLSPFGCFCKRKTLWFSQSMPMNVMACFEAESRPLQSNKGLVDCRSVSTSVQTGSGCFCVRSQMKQQVEVEKKAEVAMEMSDLVVYCQPRSKEKDRFDGYTYKEVRSFIENKLPNKSRTKEFLQYNRKALSRIYPKSQRVESSNYDPYPMWAVGCHMVALNFQTADKCTQLNTALFSLNGRTGYVLQPELMRSDTYDPYQEKKKVKYHIKLKVIAARHLPRPGRSIASPFVEVELCGHTEEKFKTIVYHDNGLNPVWKSPAEPVEFTVYEPELTFLRFVVNEEDMFSDPNFLAQATFPVIGLRSGYRSVPLKNGFSENLELASLLIYISEDLYSSSRQLKSEQAEKSEPFLYDTHNNISRSSLPREFNPLVRDASEKHKYEKHALL